MVKGDGDLVTTDEMIRLERSVSTIYQDLFTLTPPTQAQSDTFGALRDAGPYGLTGGVDDAGIFVTGIDENIAGGADGVVVYQPSTTDADGDTTIFYSLESGVEDNDLFSIDQATGEVRFVAGAADFESKTNGEFTIIITAASRQEDSDLPAALGLTTADLSSTQRVTITLNDVNEAPTALSLSAAVNFGH